MNYNMFVVQASFRNVMLLHPPTIRRKMAPKAYEGVSGGIVEGDGLNVWDVMRPTNVWVGNRDAHGKDLSIKPC